MAAPLDTLETVLNAARVRLNDAIVAIGGDVLTDNAVFTIQAINSAWRKTMHILAKMGFSALLNEVLYSTVIGTQGNINWSTTPPLPADFIVPIAMWERISGTTNYLEMDKLTRGLPITPLGPWNKYWEWRNQQINFPGTTSPTMDYRVRYHCLLPDFVANGTTSFSTQNVPIIQCLDLFSLYICHEIAAGRGDLDAKSFEEAAEKAAVIMVSRENPAVLLAPPAAGG